MGVVNYNINLVLVSKANGPELLTSNKTKF